MFFGGYRWKLVLEEHHWKLCDHRRMSWRYLLVLKWNRVGWNWVTNCCLRMELLFYFITSHHITNIIISKSKKVISPLVMTKSQFRKKFNMFARARNCCCSQRQVLSFFTGCFPHWAEFGLCRRWAKFRWILKSQTNFEDFWADTATAAAVALKWRKNFATIFQKDVLFFEMSIYRRTKIEKWVGVLHYPTSVTLPNSPL